MNGHSSFITLLWCFTSEIQWYITDIYNMRLRLTTSLIKLAEIFIEKLLIVFKQFFSFFLPQCVQFQHYPDPAWSAAHCCCQYSSGGSEWCRGSACQCTICEDSHSKCVNSLHNISLALPGLHHGSVSLSQASIMAQSHSPRPPSWLSLALPGLHPGSVSLSQASIMAQSRSPWPPSWLHMLLTTLATHLTATLAASWVV